MEMLKQLLPSNFSSLLYCFSQIEHLMPNLKEEHSIAQGGKILLRYIFKNSQQVQICSMASVYLVYRAWGERRVLWVVNISKEVQDGPWVHRWPLL